MKTHFPISAKEKVLFFITTLKERTVRVEAR